MVRVVVVTSVLAESFWDGPARAVIELWKSGEITLCVSKAMLRHYEAVVSNMGATQKEREDFMGVFSDNPFVTVVGSARRVDVVREDPAGNAYLDCAVAGGADFVITTDPHLLEMGSFRGVTFALPQDFVKAHSVGYRH